MKYVNLDDYLELLLEPWDRVRTMWETHSRYLFREYCAVYHVLSESQFGNDRQQDDKDTVVHEVNKGVSTVDCLRRKLRLFQRREVSFQKKRDQTGESLLDNLNAGSGEQGTEHRLEEADLSLEDDPESTEKRIDRIIKRRVEAGMESLDGDPKLEPVVELISRSAFLEVMKVVCPAITANQVRFGLI
jgi:hypothetical protein